MGQRQRQEYSAEFKNAIIEKILNRGPRTISEICSEAGVKYSTVDNWIRRDKSEGMKKQKKIKSWNPEEKLQALMETSSLSEFELGVYLRSQGLFSSQLEAWKKEFLSSVVSDRKIKVVKDERDQKIKSLEQEILRKDKALAEATALLILQKKVNLIWGNSDEDEK